MKNIVDCEELLLLFYIFGKKKYFGSFHDFSFEETFCEFLIIRIFIEKERCRNIRLT